MTTQQIEDAFKDCETLKGKELRGECFVDVRRIWSKEDKPSDDKPDGLVYWIIDALLVIAAIITILLI